MNKGEGLLIGTLSQKNAVITGGTQGLGRATALQFAKAGASAIVICGRNSENGRRVKAEITALGCSAHYIEADFEKFADVRKIIPAAEKLFGRLDILINAAGVTDRGNIFNVDEDQFDRIFSINVKAPYFLIQDAVQAMRRSSTAGSIVNIQSVAAHGGSPFISAYAASKGALATLTKNTANALLRYRIRVNGLNVGWMDTPGEDRVMKKYHGAEDDWLQKASLAQPFGRLIDPVEIANACVYLASDASGLLTGANIDFDQTVVGAARPPRNIEEVS